MISTFVIAMLAMQVASDSQVEQYVRAHEKELIAEIERQKSVKLLSDDQALIVYDQCLARAAVQVSRTDVPDEAVFGRARLLCGAMRADLLSGSPPARFLAFKALDEQKSAAFPSLTRQIRDRRREREAAR